MEIKVLLVDAFTTEEGRGNRAGVVLDASGLDETQMQEIARLVNVSETAFVLPGGGECDVRVRYFTPSTEVPICGHATVGAHYARAVAEALPSGTVRALTGAGLLPVDIERGPNGPEDIRIVMTQGRPQLGAVLSDGDRHDLLNALGLDENDLRLDPPVQIASTGHSKVMIPIRDPEKMHALAPDMPALAELSERIGCNGHFVFTLNAPEAEFLTDGRMFAPAIGIDEDPVTGNANGPAGLYLSHHGVLPQPPIFSYRARQGAAIGKEGFMDVTVHRNDRGVARIQIAGQAVLAGELRFRVEADGTVKPI